MNLRQILFDATGYIAADPFCAGIAVVPQIARNIAAGEYLTNPIDKALLALKPGTTGKAGLAIYAQLPFLGASMRNVPGPYFDKVNLPFLVIESELYNYGADGYCPNGVGIRADDLAAHLCQLFQLWAVDQCHTFTVTFCNPLVLGKVPAELAKTIKDMGAVFWGLELTGQLALPMLARTAMPRITFSSPTAAATVTITGATGATIWYTTDGTEPFPSNTSAAVYTAPFNQPTACTVRAAAQLTPVAPSDIAAATLN